MKTAVPRDVAAHAAAPPFVYPDYGDTCLTHVHHAILSVFTGRCEAQHDLCQAVLRRAARCSTVVLFFLDGFGLDLVQRHAGAPLVQAFTHAGAIYPLTTVFPSTTAAALASFYSGRTPLEHGLIEWNMYEPYFGQVIESLPFRRRGLGRSEELLEFGGHPGMLLDSPTLFEQLAALGVASTAFLRSDYAASAFNQASHRCARVVPYVSGADLAVQVRDALERGGSHHYLNVYWPAIDSAQHAFGPDSAQAQIEVAIFWDLMWPHVLAQVTLRQAEQVLVLFTADHGHAPVDPDAVLNLNGNARFGLHARSFARNQAGRPILPAGSPRDLFLHIGDDCLDDVQDVLTRWLAGRAEVVRVAEAVRRGWFGSGTPHPRFAERAGNLLVLPYPGFAVAWHRPGAPRFSHRGHHGGLSAAEMMIPLGVARLADLR